MCVATATDKHLVQAALKGLGYLIILVKSLLALP